MKLKNIKSFNVAVPISWLTPGSSARHLVKKQRNKARRRNDVFLTNEGVSCYSAESRSHGNRFYDLCHGTDEDYFLDEDPWFEEYFLQKHISKKIRHNNRNPFVVYPDMKKEKEIEMSYEELLEQFLRLEKNTSKEIKEYEKNGLVSLFDCPLLNQIINS